LTILFPGFGPERDHDWGRDVLKYADRTVLRAYYFHTACAELIWVEDRGEGGLWGGGWWWIGCYFLHTIFLICHSTF